MHENGRPRGAAVDSQNLVLGPLSPLPPQSVQQVKHQPNERVRDAVSNWETFMRSGLRRSHPVAPQRLQSFATTHRLRIALHVGERRVATVRNPEEDARESDNGQRDIEHDDTPRRHHLERLHFKRQVASE